MSPEEARRVHVLLGAIRDNARAIGDVLADTRDPSGHTAEIIAKRAGAALDQLLADHPELSGPVPLGDLLASNPDFVRAAPGLRCSFCEKRKTEVAHLVAWPAGYICDECVGLCNEIIAESPPDRRCSFCSKDEYDVERLIGGDRARICGECIDLCAQIQDAAREREAQGGTDGDA